MLLNLTVRNWKAFKDEATLNLVASRERQHFETLQSIPGYRTLKALPLAAVYGGNASGKTSLFEALLFLRNMIVHGPDVDAPIPVDPFLLDRKSRTDYVSFDVTFLAGKHVYQLAISLNRKRIAFESLSLLSDKNIIKDVYVRNDEDDQGFVVDNGYFSDLERINFIAGGTRNNQLFLSAAVSQNVHELKEVFTWFRASLTLVDIGNETARFGHYYGDRDFIHYAGETLRAFDTGIFALSEEPADLYAMNLPADLIHRIETAENEGTIVLTKEFKGDYDFEMYCARVGSGEPRLYKIRSQHRTADGIETFDLNRESAGTKRLMMLLPMLRELTVAGASSNPKVYVGDELDRCFHTMLSKALVAEVSRAAAGEGVRGQLLFTTHDLLLMDQDLMRRDEMNIVERDEFGRSAVISLDEFEGLRKDKDLVKSYLDGRFGGVPMFRLETQ